MPSPNAMLAMQQHAKLLQSLPQHMSEADFIRLVSASSSRTTPPKARNPEPTAFFIQQLFEGMGHPQRADAPPKRKAPAEAATAEEACCPAPKRLQASRQAYSVEELTGQKGKGQEGVLANGEEVRDGGGSGHGNEALEAVDRDG